MKKELVYFKEELARIKSAGLFKTERIISSPQNAHVVTNGGQSVLNMCANNYLGLAAHPEIIVAAHEALDCRGYGLASVRFICGTQDIHQNLERKLSAFLGTDDTILYSSCFDANTGLFETILGEDDAVISDELNHASIIDGIRLCKAKRLRYKNNDMASLENCLREAQTARLRLIATDGVFSMDGTLAKLDEICDLAERFQALVMIDDSHAVGFIGPQGRGTHEHYNVTDRVDIITGTLGKALGGASGGYTAGRQEIIDLLRQRSRPYLFSNTLAPMIVAASLRALELLENSSDLKEKLMSNAKYFRAGLKKLGFEISAGEHPIVPILLGEAELAQKMAERLFEQGVYAVGFFYPVVPRGKARIRVQISAAHSLEDLDLALAAFEAVRQEL